MTWKQISPFLKRHRLWLIALIVGLPTLTILGVQYRALRTLEQTLPYYRRAQMTESLRAVVREAEKVYLDHADQALGVPASAITHRQGGLIEDDPDHRSLLRAVAGVAEHFQRHEFRGVKRHFLFVAADRRPSPQANRSLPGAEPPASESARGPRGEVLLYARERGRLELDPQAPEMDPINVACASYLIYLKSRTVLQPNPLGNDRNSDYSLVLKPVLDAEQRIVAVAGLILDQEYFRQEVLPQAIGRVLPRFFPDEYQQAVVTLRFLQSDLVYTRRADGRFRPENDFKSEGNPRPDTAVQFFPFLMRYDLGLRMRDAGLEQWGRRSFLINLSLSVVMALLLALGLGLGWRATARETRLARMKTDFVANVSHEFRTPLASIRVLAELMKLGRVRHPDKVREYGAYIDSEGRRLTQLINNILDFSRIESGRQRYQFELTGVREILDEALAACAGRINQRAHHIEVELPAGPLPHLRLDAAAMTLALTNLLDNAIKYSGEGQEIRLRVAQTANELSFAVVDFGPGIAREEQAKIFEKFYRIGTGMVHDVKGAGLGLSLVKHIVEAHAGRVTVESTPGEGSTFTIHLPVLTAAGGLGRGPAAEEMESALSRPSRLPDQEEKPCARS